RHGATVIHRLTERGRKMDPAYLSTIAALTGSMIGGLTSLTASWLTQRVQFTTQQRANDLNRREELYRNFIEEASRLYTDAFAHDKAEVSDLVNLYALVSRMRVLSSLEIVAAADLVVGSIIDMYAAPNRTFKDVREILEDVSMNPLAHFSNVCREEL